MTVKEIIKLANLQKEVAAATSSESVIAIQNWTPERQYLEIESEYCK